MTSVTRDQTHLYNGREGRDGEGEGEGEGEVRERAIDSRHWGTSWSAVHPKEIKLPAKAALSLAVMQMVESILTERLTSTTTTPNMRKDKSNQVFAHLVGKQKTQSGRECGEARKKSTSTAHEGPASIEEFSEHLHRSGRRDALPLSGDVVRN